MQMGSSGGKSKGPPPAVKKLLGLFGSQREEDRMVGYLSFLKLGPKLLKFLPGSAAPFAFGKLPVENCLWKRQFPKTGMPLENCLCEIALWNIDFRKKKYLWKIAFGKF